MESIIEVIRHVFLGSSCVVENAELLREHGITHLLGASNNYNLRDRRVRFNGQILGCKNVHVIDTVLEVVEECNDYIHFCRKNGFSVLVHSPRSLPLSSLLIALYLKTVSNCCLQDTVRLLRHFRPDHDLEAYRREWGHFELPRGPCIAERRRLAEAWGERQPALTYFDYAILTQLQMEARRMTLRSRRRPAQTSDSQLEPLLSCKSLEEHRRGLQMDKAVKEEALRREMKERRREEKYQMAYVPDYKLTYDCHEFDESVFHNGRLADFYLPSSIDSLLYCPDRRTSERQSQAY